MKELVGLMRYGSGMPFYRLARLQHSVGVPLPASVQWEQTARVALSLEPVVEHLCQLGAQAAVFYNDDTTMRIAAVRKEIKAEKNPKRTGIFTTGIVCDELLQYVLVLTAERQKQIPINSYQFLGPYPDVMP